MDNLLITVGTDELLGLQALAKVEGTYGTATVEVEGIGAVDVGQFQQLARLALQDGLAGRLRQVDLPWAPTAETVDRVVQLNVPPTPQGSGQAAAPGESTSPAADGAVVPPTGMARFHAARKNERIRRNTGIVVGVAFLVVLIGGYSAGWAWTGFQANNQLWDWLHLLLLPVAFALLPVWLRYSEHMSRTRKLALVAVVAAFWIFVAVGYAVPLQWTGFKGQELWNWLTLIALPVTLVTVRAWPTTGREVRKTHITVFTVLGIAWVVTLIGGYAGSWKWTGYAGNTLWEWLQLLLLPIVFPTILLPAFLKWTSGGAALRAKELAAQHGGPPGAAAATPAPAVQPAQA